MHPRRKAIYYAVILASILWMTGTITFLFFQDIEVTVQVKRRLEHPVDMSRDWKSNREKQGENIIPTPVVDNQVKIGEDVELKKFVDKSITELEQEEETRTANYEREIFRDQRGVGEFGQGVNVGDDEKEKEKEGYKKHAFNQLVSDKISVHRSLKDYRHDRCKVKKYSANLPTTTVIICFHNEAWSTLLRTVHSVINRTPPQYLREIILVDDASTRDELKQRLDDYIMNLRNVKVIRLPKREGLIRARLRGAANAKGNVLTFLDAHCECTVGWVEPLLAKIKQDRTCVVMPVIDEISETNFHYNAVPEPFQRGVFKWRLEFTWRPIPQYEMERRSDETDGIKTPVMAGGLFSIDKKYFEEIGTYDEGMDIWGGENIEISFRIWMCGGSIEMLPCSRVGHVFRPRFPYSFPNRKGRDGDVVSRNLMRVADVWMDEYSKHFYNIRFDLKRKEHDDITDRLSLRKKLSCKSFQWYLKNIYPELDIPDDNYVATGEVKNPDTGLCLDTLGKQDGAPLGLYMCHGQGGNQYFTLNSRGELRSEDNCVDYNGHDLYLRECDNLGLNQKWTLKNKQMMNSRFKTCMEVRRTKYVMMGPCNEAKNQEWVFNKVEDMR